MKSEPYVKDCEKAGLYMMKYMDGEINEKETLRLKAHIDSCATCRRDFKVYDYIMGEMAADTGGDEPDEGFTGAVMAKVSVLAEGKRNAMSAVDMIICTVFGVFCVVFGLGFLFVINREQIMEYLSGVPALSGYASALEPVSERVYAFFDNIVGLAGDFIGVCAGFLSDYRYIILGVAAALIVCQYFVLRRSARSAESAVGKKK